MSRRYAKSRPFGADHPERQMCTIFDKNYQYILGPVACSRTLSVRLDGQHQEDTNTAPLLRLNAASSQYRKRLKDRYSSKAGFS